MFSRFPLICSILVGMLILAACSPASTPEPTLPAPTESPPTEAPPTEAAPTDVPPTEAPPTEAPPEAPAPPADAGGVSFTNDVQPILNSRCANCHGLERTSGDFDLTTYDLLMAGGEEGLAVIPGDAANSPLVTLPEAGKMPKRGPKLTPDQVQILKDWVNQGALNN